MAQQFTELSENHIQFISRQKIFFIGTAAASGRVNVSPKGMDTLRIMGNGRIVWLNVTGSSNETSAHVQLDPRMTIMFCAFEGDPLILRVYGSARVIHKTDAEWNTLFPLFKPLPGTRQIFDLTIDFVMTSCGAGVPCLSYTGEREALSEWAAKKGEEGIKQYWKDKNQLSLDGFPTHVVEKNG